MKRDMHRFVKWPKYVRIQRQRRVLNQRLKVRALRHAGMAALPHAPACGTCSLHAPAHKGWGWQGEQSIPSSGHRCGQHSQLPHELGAAWLERLAA